MEAANKLNSLCDPGNPFPVWALVSPSLQWVVGPGDLAQMSSKSWILRWCLMSCMRFQGGHRPDVPKLWQPGRWHVTPGLWQPLTLSDPSSPQGQARRGPH